jgi:hypothetical protein
MSRQIRALRRAQRWLTASQIQEICPECAAAMLKNKISRITQAAFIQTAFSEEQRPRWEKYWKSMGGSFTSCKKNIGSHVSDPNSFCASLKDFVTKTTHWRGKE